MSTTRLHSQFWLYCRIFALGLVAVLPFQNCTSYENEAHSKLESSLCDEEGACAEKAAALSITIDGPDHIAVEATTYNISISGTCAVGLYAGHIISLKLFDHSGLIKRIKKYEMACSHGEYLIFLDTEGMMTSQDYDVELEIIGYGAFGEEEKSTFSQGRSRLSVKLSN